MRRLWWVVIGATAVLTSCAFGPEQTTRLDETVDVEVLVLDERGEPVGDAEYDIESGRLGTGSDGRLALQIASPVAGVVVADGKLPEPLVVSPRDRSLTVRLLDRDGPDGPRTAIHFGGDVMLGRRYQAPDRPGTAVATDAASARAVVDDLAAIAAAADLTVVNAETVIGNLAPELAYPGKRFLLQSPPAILDAFDEFGVDAVTLGNNHANDWRNEGVRSTIATLTDASMPFAGAGMTADDATRGLLVAAGERHVGIVSATTVNGDFVNDQLPDADEEPPVDLPTDEAWQYRTREFSFGEPGEPGHMAAGPRRPGVAWREFRDLEPTLSEAQAAELWAALTADAAFPELQDWVARRGHGGAARYDRARIREEIARLRGDGADVVVVQFHGGFQFASVKSAFVRRISQAAIDDGADLVVSHHPHVLQGVEWYRGHLIAYSLGNLVFDQDFLATFPSTVLRVVVDGSGLVEARLLPVMIVSYRPVPAAGEVAERIVRLVATRSALPAESERIVGFEVGGVLLDEAQDGVEPASLAFERNTGRLEVGRTETTATLTSGPVMSATVPPCLLVRADTLPDDVEYGVDLFDWGGLDDGTADGERGVPMHWIAPDSTDSWAMVQGASPDPSDDALQMVTDANRRVRAGFAARVDIAAHRLFDSDDAHPADTPATYTIEFDARRERGEGASVRVDVYHVDADDPTADPESVRIRRVELPLDIADDGEWAHYVVDLERALEPAGELTADAAMITLVVDPAFRGTFDFDNVRVIEWRGAPTTVFPYWAEVDALRSDEVRTVDVTVSGCLSG